MLNVDSILLATGIIIGVIGYLPLFPYLDLFARLSFPIALCGAIWIGCRHRRGLHGLSATGVTIAVFFWYLFQARRGEIVTPAVNLLVTVLAIRFIGEKTGRNYLQIYALSLFMLASSTIFDLSPRFLLLMMGQIVAICLSLVFQTAVAEGIHRVERHQLFVLVRRSALMPALGFPIMAVLFVILPRTQFPLWNVIPGGAAATGFSDQVRPGSSSSIGETKKVVFRAAGPKLPVSQPYWRGIVLNTYAGGVWKRIELADSRLEWPKGGGERVSFTMYPEPSSLPYLIVPDAPVSVAGVRGWRLSSDLVVTAPPTAGKRKYEAVSTGFGVITARLGHDALYRDPPVGSDAFNDVAARVASWPDDDAKLAALEKEFAARRISYALRGLPTGDKAVEEFFFSRRVGHCELFASAAATILRKAGVPARLVGGYLGGVYNDIGGYYMVTEDMAHLWVEAYVHGKGWVRVDPSRWAVNFNTLRNRQEHGIIRRISLAVDSFNYYWNQAVTTYDLEKQISLLRSAGARASSLTMPQASARGAVAAGTIILAVIGSMLIRRKRLPVESVLVNRFTKRMRRVYGDDVLSPSISLMEAAAAAKDPAAMEFANLYSHVIFHDRRLTREQVRHLGQVIRRIGTV